MRGFFAYIFIAAATIYLLIELCGCQTGHRVDREFTVIYKNYQPSHTIITTGKEVGVGTTPEDFCTTVQSGDTLLIVIEKYWFFTLLPNQTYRIKGSIYDDFKLAVDTAIHIKKGKN